MSIRGVALTSSGGTLLQCLLDAQYFQEIPNFKLEAVITSDPASYAITRAHTAHIPIYVVDPRDFPSQASYCQAVANKLKDMDADLVLLTDYSEPLGEAAYRFRNRIIGIYPSLLPAFENAGDTLFQSILEEMPEKTGATTYFLAPDGSRGPIILQRTTEIRSGETPEELRSRVMEEVEWKLLPETVRLFCENRLKIEDGKVTIQDAEEKADVTSQTKREN
jgi:phosphoribosylglycinamide formyltransferase-1